MSDSVLFPDAPEIPTNPALHAFHECKRTVLRSGREILDLSMINPDLAPPRMLIDKLVEASVRPGLHRYAVARGVARLRAAFAEKYARAFSVALSPEEQICVTFGSKDAVLHTFMCFPRRIRQKKVLVGVPVYPAHVAALELLGYQLESFAVTGNECQMLAEMKASLQHGEIGSMLLNFPHNPTGIAVSPGFWQSVIELAEEYGVFVVNDFVYGELTYDSQPAASLLQADPECRKSAEIYSLSKAYSVPGWRVGALLGNPRLVHSVSALKSQVDYGLFLPLQHAAAEALSSTAGIAESHAERYSRRAGTLTEGLKSIGWEVCVPMAGCSVWSTIPAGIASSAEELTGRLLAEFGIAILPGDAFGAEWNREVRFALVQDEERLRKVIEVLDGFSYGK